MRKLANVGNDGVIFINCLRRFGRHWHKLKHRREKDRTGRRKENKMKRIMCTICLLLIASVIGCGKSEGERVAIYKRENAEAMSQHREKMMEQGGTLAEMEERLNK